MKKQVRKIGENMTTYYYNTVTGEYQMTAPFETETGEGKTTLEVPETGENEVAVFGADKWVIYPDYRFTHKMLKDGEIYVIENFGDIPEGYTLLTNAEAAVIEEKIRIANLTMTPLDFITFIQNQGISLEEINAYLEANLDVKMQLTYCNSVYCGVAKSFMPITVGDITITSEMVEQAFIEKNPEPEAEPEVE